MSWRLDQEAVDALTDAICQLPRVSWSSRPAAPSEYQVIEGGSFRLQLVLVPERGSDHAQMHIYFSTGNSDPAESWTAWVRCDSGHREDPISEPLARRFRRGFFPEKVRGWEKSEGKRAPGFVRTAHWWVYANGHSKRKDVAAQVWLFLCQAELVSKPTRAAIREWFWKYLEEDFGLTAMEASYVSDGLFGHYWRPPSAPAWRAYLGEYAYRSSDRVLQRQSLGDRRLRLL